MQLAVAGAPYCHGPGVNRACPALRETPLPAGLHLAVRLSTTATDPTQQVTGHLVVTWTGRGTWDLDSGQPLIASVFRPGSTTVLSTYSGGIGGTGYGMRLADGQSERIPLIVGLSRCGGGRGSALAPGRYDVRVDDTSENPGDHAGYLSPRRRSPSTRNREARPLPLALSHRPRGPTPACDVSDRYDTDR